MDIIQLERWKPSEEDPRRLEYAGQPTAQEVFEELKHRQDSGPERECPGPDVPHLLRYHQGVPRRPRPVHEDRRLLEQFAADKNFRTLSVLVEKGISGGPSAARVLHMLTCQKQDHWMAEELLGKRMWVDTKDSAPSPAPPDGPRDRISISILADPASTREQLADAIVLLTRAAEAGLDAAQYALGKLHLEIENFPAALRWFQRSAEMGSQDHMNDGTSLFTCAAWLLHYIGRIFQDQTPQSLTGVHLTDSKLRRKMRDKRIALGHRPDDHEDTMMR